MRTMCGMRYLLVAVVLTACASHTHVTCETLSSGATIYSCRDMPVNVPDLRVACPEGDGISCVDGEGRCQVAGGDLGHIVCGDTQHDISLE